MSWAVVSARSAGLDTSRSGFTSRLARRLPILGASFSPRSANGRSRSANVGSSLLDLACRTRNKVFIAVSFRRLLHHLLTDFLQLPRSFDEPLRAIRNRGRHLDVEGANSVVDTHDLAF